jgi:nicotinate-nucleotide pyrophosphorylase (carboxylating)
MNFTDQRITDFIRNSLAEDVGNGDHSSLAAIPIGVKGKAQLIFKEEGVAAGLDLAKAILHHVDDNLDFNLRIQDGEMVRPGNIGFEVSGNVHSILMAERLLLNCMQRLSGIATTTHKFVQLVEDCNVKILDTRKTTPGLRFLEKWAVTVGGGFNHREGLYDMIMLKDNHVDYAGGVSQAIERTIQYLKENYLDLKIEVETRNLDEVKQVLQYPEVFRIMLDNFPPEGIPQAVNLIRGRAETEVSGGINLDNVRDYAQSGVDYISIGALTHSVKSLDISLKQV